MPTTRRGRSALVTTTPESEQTVSEESADMDTRENTADIAVEVTGEQEAAGNGGTETEEMTVDLEVKDSTPIVTKPPVVKPVAPKPTVEVMIEGLSDSGDQTKVADTPADNTVITSVGKNTDTNSGETSPSKQIGSTETAVTEESLTTVAKVESDVSVVAAATEPTDTGSQESVDTNETAEPSTQTATTTAEPSKEESKPEAKQPTASVVTKPPRDRRMHSTFPDSLAKLRNLTVNIGPIRQFDLKSETLHDVLKLSDKYEIKFELRDKKNAEGKVVKEKSGFVRLPMEITTPTFLIRVAYILGNLHIDGRDMSVKFPEAFNKALADSKQYVADGKKIRTEKLKMKRRQIAVKNVPANVTEETVRSLFPKAQTITLNMESTSEGSKVGSVRLDFESEEACIQCLDTSKDVFIEDNQLKIFRLYTEKKPRGSRSQNNRGRGFGRGRGIIQRGGFQPMHGRGGVAGVTRGRGAVSSRGKSASVTSSPQTSTRGRGAMGPPSKTPRGSYGSSSLQGQFKDFTPANRQGNRARQRGSRGGLGSIGYGQQRRDEPQRSPYRNDRSPQQRSMGSYRADTSYSPARSPRASASKGEDPSAIMAYIKTTLSRMEQKMSSRDHNDQSYDRQGAQSRNGNQLGGMNSGSSTNQNRFGGVGRGNLNSSNRGRNNQNRKRAAADNRDYGQQAKRQFVGNTDQSRRDSKSTNYYGSGSQQNTGGRWDSVGNVIGTVVSDYRYDNEGSNRSGTYGGGSDRTRRDSYGSAGRSDTFNTGYSGSQFMSSGGGGAEGGSSGWGGQAAMLKGYNQSSFQGQTW